jgi:hypothetical protein
MENENIDNSLINIKLSIYIPYKNDKSLTIIEYSELTKNLFINILSNNMNLLKIIIIDDFKTYEFFINPFLLLDFINNNGYLNVRYYFNKKIYIDLNSNYGIQLINKCREFYISNVQLFIQPIIIIKFTNNNKIINNNNDISKQEFQLNNILDYNTTNIINDNNNQIIIN